MQMQVQKFHVGKLWSGTVQYGPTVLSVIWHSATWSNCTMCNHAQCKAYNCTICYQAQCNAVQQYYRWPGTMQCSTAVLSVISHNAMQYNCTVIRHNAMKYNCTICYQAQWNAVQLYYLWPGTMKCSMTVPSVIRHNAMQYNCTICYQPKWNAV